MLTTLAYRMVLMVGMVTLVMGIVVIVQIILLPLEIKNM